MKMSKLIPLKSDSLHKVQLTYSAKMKMPKLIPLKSDGLQKFQLTSSAKMKLPRTNTSQIWRPAKNTADIEHQNENSAQYIFNTIPTISKRFPGMWLSWDIYVYIYMEYYIIYMIYIICIWHIMHNIHNLIHKVGMIWYMIYNI